MTPTKGVPVSCVTASRLIKLQNQSLMTRQQAVVATFQSHDEAAMARKSGRHACWNLL
jgi:hypothetical protein